ncbi:hypothetical protein BC936DRAFT_147455 [Jimgerdemannia flammicorona]|uniref:tRNA-dihydrouridine synthase n=1 Tax=Jimgerdemannia flammicorona TaxID=994334 RepID=A0A433D5B6_9FUNG|nr:hypothetical protein BC936DRAFT_147455 [Jimgerdemannia flammicorona]
MPTTIRLRHSISLHRNALITLPNVRSVTSGIPLPRKSRLARTTSVAPMIDVTNPHFLHLLRLISSSHTLYSEMVHANAIIKNAPSPSSPASLYRFIGDPHPDTVVQLGGSDPEQMARAAKIVEQVGFGEVNVNVGCPSDRVQVRGSAHLLPYQYILASMERTAAFRAQHGCFGVVLMKTPDRVASILDAMHAHGVHIPVTVKCRIGVDDLDSYEYLCHFVRHLIPVLPIKFRIRKPSSTKHFSSIPTQLSTLLRSSLPPTHVIVHARKAWLHGLSPKQNRTVPPLDYERVWRLAKEFHGLVVTANGGFDTVEKVRSGLERCDGIMIGRKGRLLRWWSFEEKGMGMGR